MGYRTRLIVLLLGLTIVLGFAALQFFLSDKNTGTTVNNTPMVKETVGRGDVLRTVKTSGVVESDQDILLRSPERSIVKTVRVNAGSKVSKGDLLVELEEKSINQEMERMNQQLEVKRNTLEKYLLNQENTKLSLKQSEEMKRQRIASLKTSLMQQEQALKVGGVDTNRVERTKNEINLAETDLQNLIDKNAIRIQQMETDKKGLELQISAQEEDLANKQRLINKLRITAPSAGVIQEISVQPGQRVESEQLLLKMSNFTTFKVVGWANVSVAGLFATGDSTIVEIDGKKFHGTVGEIAQTFEDQMIRFDVHLENNQDAILEINKSVAVEVISAFRADVLRIKKQDGIENTTQQSVYLIDGEKGVKTNVILGIIGNEWVEVVSGLQEGDVIISSGATLADSPPTIEVN